MFSLCTWQTVGACLRLPSHNIFINISLILIISFRYLSKKHRLRQQDLLRSSASQSAPSDQSEDSSQRKNSQDPEGSWLGAAELPRRSSLQLSLRDLWGCVHMFECLIKRICCHASQQMGKGPRMYGIRNQKTIVDLFNKHFLCCRVFGRALPPWHDMIHDIAQTLVLSPRPTMAT